MLFSSFYMDMLTFHRCSIYIYIYIYIYISYIYMYILCPWCAHLRVSFDTNKHGYTAIREALHIEMHLKYMTKFRAFESKLVHYCAYPWTCLKTMCRFEIDSQIRSIFADSKSSFKPVLITHPFQSTNKLFLQKSDFD